MRRLLGDLRALGRWAPVRAVYEITTRLGVTGRINRRRSGVPPSVPLRSPFITDIPLPTTDDLTSAADLIVGGAVPVFATTADFSTGIDWRWSETGRSWPSMEWWKIPVRPDDDRDVKYVFELGRHDHLVTLAAAARASDDPGPYLTTLEEHLRTWCEQNPPEMGIHWLSNLEIALRAVSWLRVWHLVGDRLSDDVAAAMTTHLYHSGRHIVGELPYTLSSMRNNHLIGDAVGLAAIGSAFEGDRSAARWVQRGDRLLAEHLRDHVHGDGSTIEDSLGYRAFVLDLLTVRGAMTDPPAIVERSAKAIAAHLQRLGSGRGPVPRFGDWDGGSAGGTSVEEQPEGALARSAGVFGAGTDTPTTDGSDAGGQIGRITRGPWTVWLKCDAGESHGHADLLSVAVAHGSRWVAGDPGNGSYNRSADDRDAYRISAAHNVLRVEGEDQRVPHRRFRWRHQPDGRLGAPFDAGRYRVMWGTHDAYRRLAEPRTVLRACFVSDDAVIVADWLDGSSSWDLSVLLYPGVIVDDGPGADDRRGLRVGDDQLELVLPGTAVADRGAWADGYDQVTSAVRLSTRGASAGPVVWALAAGDLPDVSGEGAALIVDGTVVVVSFGDDGAMELALSR